MITFPTSVLQAFVNVCDRTPDQACVVFEDRTHTYADLYAAAAGWAEGLRAWGLQPGDRVALFLESSPEFIAAYLGVHLAGGMVVLVNTQYRQTELRHIFNDAGARLCITDAERLAELVRVAEDLAMLEAVVITDENPPPAEHPFAMLEAAMFAVARPTLGAPRLPAADEIAILAYTSGTTGQAKGAMLHHGALAANSAAVTAAWRWTAADTLLLALPLFHIHGLGVGVHGTLLTGATLRLQRRFAADAVYAALARGAATMFFGVPTMYARLLAESEQHPDRSHMPVRLFVSGSAPLSPQTFTEFERRFGHRILERYGMTETGMNLGNPYDGERRPGSVGVPFPYQEARVVDVETRRPLPDGETGEIQVRGSHVFKGYWQRPIATAEAFDAAGWFNTGDLGWRAEDGYFTIAGRAKELIISGGYNIYPREVEDVLEQHPVVAEAAVIGTPHPFLGEQVAAFIVRSHKSAVCHPNIAIDALQTPDSVLRSLAEEVISFCRDRLADYKRPRRIFFIGNLPRNALGKIQKHRLREMMVDKIGDS